MIGHKMYQVLSNVYADTWVLLRKKLDQINAKEIFNENKCIDNFDLIHFDKLHSLLYELKPDIIINAAGITIRRGVNETLYKSIIINAALPHFLDNWAKINKKRLIHFSTDCVFSGKDGFYSEKNIPDATDVYGKTKAMGEVSSTNSLTLRGSMIGRELENKTEILEWFLNQTNETINGYNKVIYSGITTCKMAEYVLRIITNYPQMNGIYNVSSISISKFTLLTLFNIGFKKGVSIIPDDSYTSNKDLISTNFFNFIFCLKPNWNELIEDLLKDCELNSKYY